MSGQLVREVLKEQEQQETQEGDLVTEELLQSLHIESDSHGHVGNPFDLLNDDDEHEHDQEDKSSASYVILAEKVDNSELNTKHSVPAISMSKKSKKKQKKNKQATFLSGEGSGKSVEVDLEALSLYIDSSSHEAMSNKKASAIKDIKADETEFRRSRSFILRVDAKFLNAENELRWIFGSEVVSSSEKVNRSGSSRQVCVGRYGGYRHRNCILVSPLDHCPFWDGSLSMELLETNGGKHFFRYVGQIRIAKHRKCLKLQKQSLLLMPWQIF